MATYLCDVVPEHPRDVVPEHPHLNLLDVCAKDGFVSLGRLGEFSELTEVGRGSFGVVFKAKKHPAREPGDFAIKHTLVYTAHAKSRIAATRTPDSQRSR